MEQTQFLRMLFKVLRLPQQKKRKKKNDFEVSHFEVIRLVLIAFMEFIHINKVVMWFINRIFVVSLLLLVLVLL